MAHLAPINKFQIDSLRASPSDTRMTQVFEWFEARQIESQILNYALEKHWTDGGYLNHPTPEPAAAMFRFAGFVSDNHEKAVAKCTFRVYRGGIAPANNGVAWTTDPDVAAWFAYQPTQRRIEGRDDPSIPLPKSELIVANASSEGILGKFAARGESELVIEPTSIVEIARVPATDPIIPHFHLMRSLWAHRRRLKIWLVDGAPDGDEVPPPKAIERGIAEFTQRLRLLDRKVDRSIWLTERIDLAEYFVPS